MLIKINSIEFISTCFLFGGYITKCVWAFFFLILNYGLSEFDQFPTTQWRQDEDQEN